MQPDEYSVTDDLKRNHELPDEEAITIGAERQPREECEAAVIYNFPISALYS